MSRNRVLIVVPDEDLRRSLAFALETHGHTVIAASDWGQPGTDGVHDCVVVHERALRDCNGTDMRKTRCERIILLAYGPDDHHEIAFASVVQMPLKGEAVIDAVAAALAVNPTK